MKGKKAFLMFAIVVCAVLALAVVRGIAQRPAAEVKPAPIPEGEYDPAFWGKFYPLQYKSYLKNLEIPKEVRVECIISVGFRAETKPPVPVESLDYGKIRRNCFRTAR